MFKVNRTTLLTHLVKENLTVSQLAERAACQVDDVLATHLSMGKATRLALALKVPVKKMVFRAPRVSA